MSWREVARQVRERGEHDESARDERDVVPAFEATPYERDEREAIASVDGGLPQTWAASLVALEHSPRPAGISERDWRAALDQIWTRADEHGCAFAANGWTFEEVFGVGEHWARLHERGAAWLALGARIVAIDPHHIVYERGGKRTQHQRRPN